MSWSTSRGLSVPQLTWLDVLLINRLFCSVLCVIVHHYQYRTLIRLEYDSSLKNIISFYCLDQLFVSYFTELFFLQYLQFNIIYFDSTVYIFYTALYCAILHCTVLCTKVFRDSGNTIDYKLGAMMEVPRACMRADAIVQEVRADMPHWFSCTTCYPLLMLAMCYSKPANFTIIISTWSFSVLS